MAPLYVLSLAKAGPPPEGRDGLRCRDGRDGRDNRDDVMG